MSYIGNTATQQAFTPAIDFFSGNGSTVAFTLSRPVASAAQVQVNVNNVAQNPSTAFTVLNSTITFTGAPSSGTNNIYVQYTSPITQVIQPGQGTVTPTSLAVDGTFQFPNISYTGTLTGSGGIINIGSGQIYKDASGNVGIGTSSPAFKLDVFSQNAQFSYSGAGGANLRLNNTSGTSSKSQITWLASGTAKFSSGVDVGAANSNNFYWYDEVAGATRMLIDSSGNLLVGTPSVNYLGAGFTLSGNSGTTKWICGPRASAPNEFVISAASSLGVYLTSTSATSWTSASDERLKDIIEPISDATNKVSTLRAVIGKYKADGENTRRSFLIAQDIQAVLPEAVSVGMDDMLGVQYTEVIPLLVAAIQELKAINDTQAQAITTLTERITALEAK